MAKFILKWRYIKSGTKGHGTNLVKYIATRDGVELCDESWKKQSATDQQNRIIKKLQKECPEIKESFEYQDYQTNPTKYTATLLIDKMIEENLDRIGTKENYVEYIALRPRVEKEGKHGLFSMTDVPIDLNKVAREVSNHQGLVWTTILSLQREDAERLGYDNANAWKDTLRAKSGALAKGMGIPLKDLKWYAAFHNEGHHPHVHLISYSTGKEPYITQAGLKRMKSELANEIFKQDLYQVFVEKTKYRDELRKEGKEKVAELIKAIHSGEYKNETVEFMMQSLVEELKVHKGKKVYGYLSKKGMNLVNGIVEEIAKDERIAKLYELWYQQQEEIVKTYQDKKEKRVPLSCNEDFKSIRNAVVKEAVNLLTSEYAEKKQEWQSYQKWMIKRSSIRLFHQLGKILEEQLEKGKTGRGQTESKLRRMIDEKKRAHGIRQE